MNLEDKKQMLYCGGIAKVVRNSMANEVLILDLGQKLCRPGIVRYYSGTFRKQSLLDGILHHIVFVSSFWWLVVDGSESNVLCIVSFFYLLGVSRFSHTTLPSAPTG